MKKLIRFDFRILTFAFLFFAFSLLHFDFANAQIPSYVPNNGLVAWYPFNGNANDESGNGNNGTVNGATLTADRFGNVGKAYEFSASRYSHVKTNTIASTITDNFSYSVWVNAYNNIQLPTEGSQSNFTNQCVIHPTHGSCFGNADTHSGSGLYVGQNGIVVKEHSTLYTRNALVYSANLSGWHLITITYSNKLPMLYIDGQLIKNGIADSRSVHPSIGNDNNSLGDYSKSGFGAGFNSSLNNSPQFFNGKIDDLSFYNRALTQQEITGLYTGVAPCIANITNNDTAICKGSSITLNATAVGNGSVTDINGNNYPTVNIGTQTWMQKNLNVSRYKNGDIIPQVTDPTQWANLTTGAWCWSNNDSVNFGKYGKLYNWYAVNDPRGLAPDGWRVASMTDFGVLNKNLDRLADTACFACYPSTVTGGMLKETGTTNWFNTSARVSNSSGFTALPGGVRLYNGQYLYDKWYASFWSTTPMDNMKGRNFSLFYAFDSSIYDHNDKKNGNSIRCLKNTPITYLWSNGATTPSINVSPTVTTKYYCTVSNGTTTCKDSVTVTVSTIATNIITADTVKACGTSATITAIAGLSSYSWSNGATSQSTTVTSSSWYKCTATNGACTARDSVYVSLFNPKIVQNDTTVCAGSSLSIQTKSDPIIDINGNIYPTVNIGNQNWMQKNLNVSRYRNGDIIPQVTDPAQWASLTAGAWCWYNNDSVNYSKYGKLYNWYAVSDPRGLAPDGWRVPEKNDYFILSKYLDNNTSDSSLNAGVISTSAGYYLKSNDVNIWQQPNNANNSSGFGSMGTGSRNGSAGNFWYFNQSNGLWVKNAFSNTEAYFFDLSYNSSSFSLGSTGVTKTSGFSVRCLRNQSTSYLWSTGATTSYITVSPTATTSYIATVSNGIQSCKDTVKVTVSSITTNIITADTVKVCGTSASISAVSGFSSYSWSNGANTSSTTFTNSDWYKCTVTNSLGCRKTDSVYVSLFNPKIVQNDTAVCAGSSLSIQTTSGPIIDINGNLYPTVNIGNQNWMQKNLNVSRYRNGDIIPQVTDPAQWASLTAGAWCWYNNDSVNYSKYGKLYNWYAVSDPRGLAPDGWRVPEKIDYFILSKYLDNNTSDSSLKAGVISTSAGYYLKSNDVNFWQQPNNANNSSGFGSMGTGSRNGSAGNFWYFNQSNGLWVKNSFSNTEAYFFDLSYNSSSFSLGSTGVTKTSGFSVRCLRNQFASYLWSTGATTPSITVSPTATTSYIVTVSNGIQSCKDTIKVTVSSITTNIITADTVKVCGTSASISAVSGFSSYSWSNGANTSSTTVTNSGWYKCTVSNGICTKTDSVYVSLFNPKIVQNDTTVCAGTSLILNVGNNLSSPLTGSLRTGLVGYWPFNGNANDESGNGNHGTVNGATLTSDRFGNVGGAYWFNGNNSNITIGSNAALNLTNLFSVNLWINSSTYPIGSTGNHMIVKGSNSTNEYSMTWSNYKPAINRQNVQTIAIAGNPLDTNKWYNLTFVYNHPTANIFVDNALVATGTANSQIIASNSPLYFGTIAGQSGSNLVYKGLMDDIKIYNRALSPSEIQQLYSGASSILWSTGATTPSITVNPTVATSYIVTVSNGIQSCKDTLKVSIQATPVTPVAIQKEFSPVSIPAVTNVSGLVSETYRIRKVANSVSYDWSLKRGTLASITHINPLGVNDTAVTVTFNPCFLRDTLCVKSVGVCSSSVAKTVILTSNTTPANIEVITAPGGNFASCIGSTKVFTAYPATPTTSQTTISRYRWTLPANVVLVSANTDSSSITVQINTGFVGGNISVRGVNACTGTLGTALSTVLQFLPPTASGIISSTGSYNACINNTITYSAMVGAPSATQAMATVFRWTRPANTTITSATADSSSITLRFNTGFTSGTLSVGGQTICGTLGTARSVTLTSTGCRPAPRTIANNTPDLKGNDYGLDAQLYPNPSAGSFNLKINTSSTSPIIVKVMNTNGQLMKSFIAKANVVSNIGNELKPGVYMVEVLAGVERKVIRAVKQ